MQAVVLRQYGGPEVLVAQSVPSPVPGPEEVLIGVRAVGVNRADLLQREGHYPPPNPRPNLEILGLECAGEVLAVGERVSLFRPGQRVATLVTGGAYAEQVTVHERMAFLVPAALTWLEAAAIPEAFLTGYDALADKAAVSAGQVVLVHAGASGVGSATVQLAAWMGARVVSTVSSQEKADFVLELGAVRAICYQSERFVDALKDLGWSVNTVIDFVGRDYWADNVACLAPSGVLVVVGTLSGATATIDLGQILAKRITIRGTALRSRPLEARMQLMQAFVANVLPAIASGRLKPLVDTQFPLAQAGDAHRYMAENRVRGKIILTVDS